jgi:ferric-dicitrate binding protein FerR (iron transport regulator)
VASTEAERIATSTCLRSSLSCFALAEREKRPANARVYSHVPLHWREVAFRRDPRIALHPHAEVTMNTHKKLLGAALLATLLTASVVAPAMAQTGTGTGTTTTTDAGDDDGFDWGLLGLLGLLGLIPRKHHDSTRR